MPVTIIPADDNSGATAGWQMLATAMQRRFEREHETNQAKKVAYQTLIANLSDPNTTEEQQNAILSQDPAQFKNAYGVDIKTVGRDIKSARAAAGPGMGPGVLPGAAGGPAVESKRVLVAHPGGTPVQQKAAADIAQTREQTLADTQRRAYYEQATDINRESAVRDEANFNTTVKQQLRTVDNKVPTIAQAREYRAGNLDLYPTTEMGKKLDSVRELLGGDPNDPAVRMAIRDMATNQKITQADLDKTLAEVEAATALAAERNQRVGYLQRGIDPDTGKSLLGGAQIDPREMITVGKGFNEALSSALGPLGMPNKADTVGGGMFGAIWGTAGIHDYFTRKIIDDPKLGPAIFGNGSADPATVRADLLAVIGPDRKVKTITFPYVDPKTGLTGSIDMPMDKAIATVTQIRRGLTTSLPPVFAAMRALSPPTLLEMAAGNPLIEQASRAYAPDIAAAIDAARANRPVAAAAGTPGGGPGSPTADPNAAPLIELRDKFQREIDDIRNMIRGKAGAPAAAATSTDASLQP